MWAEDVVNVILGCDCHRSTDQVDGYFYGRVRWVHVSTVGSSDPSKHVIVGDRYVTPFWDNFHVFIYFVESRRLALRFPPNRDASIFWRDSNHAYMEHDGEIYSHARSKADKYKIIYRQFLKFLVTRSL